MNPLRCCLFLLLVLFGCTNHRYILSREETLRLEAIPEFAREERRVPAILDSGDSQSPEKQDAQQTLVRAGLLDLPAKKWLDQKRALVPAKQPVGLVVSGGIFLGVGLALSLGAVINQFDMSCTMKPHREEFLGPCGGRGILTMALATSGALRGLVGIGLLMAGAGKWSSPEVQRP